MIKTNKNIKDIKKYKLIIQKIQKIVSFQVVICQSKQVKHHFFHCHSLIHSLLR